MHAILVVFQGHQIRKRFSFDIAKRNLALLAGVADIVNHEMTASISFGKYVNEQWCSRDREAAIHAIGNVRSPD